MHHSSSYANRHLYTWTVLHKIVIKFYSGSFYHSIIIYSSTSHEKTPTFYLPDDDLRKSKRCSFLSPLVPLILSYYPFLMAYSNLNFGHLLHRIENIDIKNNIRFYEKIKKRILSAKYGILFNQICIYMCVLATGEEKYNWIYFSIPCHTSATSESGCIKSK